MQTSTRCLPMLHRPDQARMRTRTRCLSMPHPPAQARMRTRTRCLSMPHPSAQARMQTRTRCLFLPHLLAQAQRWPAPVISPCCNDRLRPSSEPHTLPLRDTTARTRRKAAHDASTCRTRRLRPDPDTHMSPLHTPPIGLGPTQTRICCLPMPHLPATARRGPSRVASSRRTSSCPTHPGHVARVAFHAVPTGTKGAGRDSLPPPASGPHVQLML